MVSAIAEYLAEFPLDGSKEVKPLFRSKQPRAMPSAQVDDTAELIREAEERGRREGRAEAQKEFEAALAEERARSDERFIAEREKWAQEEAIRLASQLAANLESLETRLVDRVARIMAPFLVEALHAQMLDELQRALSTLLTNGQNKAIRISGPEDILSRLVGRLGKYEAAIELVTSDGPDVSVVSGDTIIDTQLAAWSQRLMQAVQLS